MKCLAAVYILPIRPVSMYHCDIIQCTTNFEQSRQNKWLDNERQLQVLMSGPVFKDLGSSSA